MSLCSSGRVAAIYVKVLVIELEYREKGLHCTDKPSIIYLGRWVDNLLYKTEYITNGTQQAILRCDALRRVKLRRYLRCVAVE